MKPLNSELLVWHDYDIQHVDACNLQWKQNCSKLFNGRYQLP